VLAVAYSSTGREFVSGSYDRTLRIWDARSARSREV
jgi:singapore isolate B (sub-type 7) whole genome shotgun sequence assembly, scaffold_14